MAEFETEAATAVLNLNINGAEHEFHYDHGPEEVLPGQVRRYNLSDEDVPEEPFDAIMYYAIEESGETSGPLNTERLKRFLTEDVDQRIEKILTVVQHFTPDTHGLFEQLKRLRQRVDEISANENHLTVFFKERVKALVDGTSMPRIHMFDLSKVAYKALGKAADEGPLSRERLMDLITSGELVSNEGPETQRIKDQLNKVLRYIRIQKSKDKTHFDKVYKRISKDINDLRVELLRNQTIHENFFGEM